MTYRWMGACPEGGEGMTGATYLGGFGMAPHWGRLLSLGTAAELGSFVTLKDKNPIVM